jgi:alpha-glucosidase
LDLVINHTSDEHAWFKESRRSKDNSKRDWYIWRPAKYAADGSRMPPNNWKSYFGGSAWEWDETTEEYFLHLFAKQQPDLNWENKETRTAIYQSSMEFWLQKGVDGFRIDTVNMYSKGPELQDAPVIDDGVHEQPAWDIYCNGPRMHEFLREMNTQVLHKYDTITVGELPHTPDSNHVLRYVGSGDKQLNMVFQFDIVDLGSGKTGKYDYQGFTLPEFKAVVAKWQTFHNDSDGWTTAFCENHDQGRSVSRYASDAPEWRERSAKLLALTMCSKTGTLFIYQGQEIGMINIDKDWPIEDCQDIEAVNYYKNLAKRTNNDPRELTRAMDAIRLVGRDNARTPMQWDSSEWAGFTNNKDGAWMRVNKSYKDVNVASQIDDANSPLNFWTRMLKIRKAHRDIFIHGTFEGHDMNNKHTFVFTKKYQQKRAVVALNFTAEERKWDRSVFEGNLQFLIGNVEGTDGSGDTLQGYEGRIYLLN